MFSVGHGDPRVNKAVAEQMEKVAYGYRYLFTTDPLEEMSERICNATGMADMVYTTSGSEAVESAVKIALQYHFDRGDPKRVKFIARKRSWHGNTMMATALSGFEDRQRAFAGALPVVGRVSAANAYRLPPGVSREGLVAHLARQSWKPKSSGWGRTPWRPSSSNRSWALRVARCLRPKAMPRR